MWCTHFNSGPSPKNQLAPLPPPAAAGDSKDVVAVPYFAPDSRLLAP
jgi:hypothetical protein